MIYTLTLNPAIDYVMRLQEICEGAVNRACGEEAYVGGKGINVSIILKELGVPTTALGFVAGFTGEFIKQSVRDMGIDTDFVQLKSGFSRINVKLKSSEETDINGMGPEISADELSALFDKVKSLKTGDILVLSGNAPKSVPKDIYSQLLENLKDSGVVFVVDAEGDQLLSTLKYRPLLIKPNIHELGSIFGTDIKDADDALPYAKKLREMGAQNVLVSLGHAGALLIDEQGEIHLAAAPKGEAINSTGAGDTMLAAFICSYLENSDYAKALKFAVAAGSATAFSSGLAKAQDIYHQYSNM